MEACSPVQVPLSYTLIQGSMWFGSETAPIPLSWASLPSTPNCCWFVYLCKHMVISQTGVLSGYLLLLTATALPCLRSAILLVMCCCACRFKLGG
jgi:hypothetical protein